MEKLKELLSRKFLFLGVGNPERGDDGIGLIVVSRLSTENKLDCGPVPENFTGKIRRMGPEVIIMVDAVDFGGNPGDITLSEAEKVEGLTLTTHSMPFSVFCRMLPESEIYLLGVQPKDFSSMSGEIRLAGEKLAEEINKLLI